MAIFLPGDFVRLDTTNEAQPEWRLAGVRFNKIIPEFNANSAMRVAQVNGSQSTLTCTRDGRPAGTWPMNMVVKVTAPVSNPPPPLVPDAI